MEVPTMKRETKDQELYRLAYQCEELKAKGCNNICAQCPLYLPNYTSFYNEDQYGIGLIQSSAAIDFNRIRQYQQASQRRDMIWGVIGIGLMIWCVFSFRSCVTPSHKPLTVFNSPPTQTIVIPAQDQAIIDRAVRVVRETVFDINGDGLVNCIDYAIMFCMLYERSHIILNNNPQTGMNHLFNGVHVSGAGYVYIDPQTGRTMEEQWGAKYNKFHNVNRTTYYIMELMLADFFVGPADTSENEATRKQALQMLRDRMDGR